MQKNHDLTSTEMAAIIDKLSDEDKIAYQRDLTAFGRGCIYHAADGSYRYMPSQFRSDPMTYRRLKTALQQIAAGASDPAAVAAEALRSRIRPKQPPKPLKGHKYPRWDYIAVFAQWIKLDKPSIQEFARIYERTPQRMREVLNTGAWLCQRGDKHPILEKAARKYLKKNRSY